VRRRLLALAILVALTACPYTITIAGAPPTEIRLGKAPPVAPQTDPAPVRAVERFFAARQRASLDRTQLPAARRWLTSAVKADASTLAGDPGHTLVAFDFTDGSIEKLGGGRFRVDVYLLFADRQGKVVESRDEILVFIPQAGGYACAALVTAGTMRWDSAEVEKSADRLHCAPALDQADASLREWATRQTRLSAYSIEDVFPAGMGRIMIPCLKFTAAEGKRGYDVVDSPIIMRRGSRGYQIEPVAN